MSKKWDPHKDKILRLYIVENMKLEQVMSHMLQTHGFDQKHAHFISIIVILIELKVCQDHKRRPSQGLASDVIVADGIVFSESRIKRARRRYNLDLSTARWYGKAPSPKTPPGHEISRTGPPASEVAVDWPGSLPWLQFEKRFKLVAPKSTSFIQALARNANDCGLITGMKFDESTDLARAIYAASHETSINATNLARMLPYIPKGSCPSAVDIGTSDSDDLTTKILKAFMFQISNKVKANHGDSPWGDNLILLFEELDKTNPMVLGQLIDSNDPTSEAIIESLYQTAIEYGATALASRLLEAGKDANALLQIGRGFQCSLSRGKGFFEFNETIVPMTALQFAAFECNIQLATALIDAGAKANLGQPTPLQILCLHPKFRHQIFKRPGIRHPTLRPWDAVRFADLLISNGAQVDRLSNHWISPLEGAILSKNISLVRFLIQRGATDVLNWQNRSLQKPRLEYILARFPVPKGHKFLISGKNYIEAPPTSALQLAILSAESSIARDLVSSIIKQESGGTEILEQALVTACAAGDEDVAQEVLKNLDSQLEDSPDLINSAFFAAAWDLDCKVAQLLVKHEAVRRKLQNSCVPAFQGAALQGNVKLIMLLHFNGFDLELGPSLQFGLKQKDFTGRLSPPMILPTALSTPLGCAVWMGHKDAIEALLNLGANIAGIDLIPAIRTGSHQLITQLLVRYSNASNLRGGQSVLDIAIRYGVGLNMICKLIYGGAVCQGHELVDAVRSNDLEVVNFFLPLCDILATNLSGENVVEAASRTGNVKVALDYFACGGQYRSRALLLAVSRAVKMDDYRIIESIVANRPPGPIDECEASALALSIRVNNSTLMDILLQDAFQPSAALSIYCDILGNPFQGYAATLRREIYPLDFEDLGLDVQKVAPKPCFTHRHSPCHLHSRCKHYPHCVHHSPCDQQFSPLLVAAALAQERVVRKMLDCGYPVDPYLFIMLYRRSYTRKGVRDMIVSAYDSQISNVADQDWHRRMLLTTLEYGVDLGVVQKHFAKLPSLNFYQGVIFCPLRSAVESDSYDHVKAVLEAGATASWHSRDDILNRAIFNESTEILSLLLDNGLDINCHPPATFSISMIKGNFGITAFLLDHGLDINASVSEPDSEDGIHTCLESAAAARAIDAVEMLFSRALNIQGRARIHLVGSVALATENCHYTMAKFLKERGGWNDEDDELAKTPRGRVTYHACPRFVYDDPNLEWCLKCESSSDTAPMTEFSEEGESAINSPRSCEAIDKQSTSDETESLNHDMSLQDIESETMDYEQTAEVEPEALGHEQINEMMEWSFTSYGPQDRALDIMVEGFLDESLLLEDSISS